MDINKKLNKVIEVIFMIALVGILVFVSNISIISLGLVPVLFSIYIFRRGYLKFLLVFILTSLAGFLYMDLFDNLAIFSVFLLLSLVFSLNIKYLKTDKAQIVCTAIITCLIFIGLYKLSMYKEGLSLDDLANGVRQMVEMNYDYKFSTEAYKLSLSLYPSIFAFFAMIYSLLGIKVIRNYINIKDGSLKDLEKVNEIRIEKKNLLTIGVFVAIIYIVSKILRIEEAYIRVNIFAIILEILAFNGLSAYDYMIARSNIPLSRGFQWFFIIILLQFLLVLFIILGFIDIILDIRKKRSLNEK